MTETKASYTANGRTPAELFGLIMHGLGFDLIIGTPPPDAEPSELTEKDFELMSRAEAIAEQIAALPWRPSDEVMANLNEKYSHIYSLAQVSKANAYYAGWLDGHNRVLETLGLLDAVKEAEK